jgi:hypothetical protein
VADKIRKGQYQPRPCLHKSIPKPSGGQRVLSIFTVVDSAVSSWLYRTLLGRNAQLFSSYSYAYRADRNAHHAIEHIYGAVKGRKRLFLLEYDFLKYFDSISHDYLLDVMKRYLVVSPRERKLIEAFLGCRYAVGTDNYKKSVFQKTEKGVPQGTSLSLFLANVACLQLDRELEKIGATFARYADDTIILCEDYATASRAASAMLAHGDRSGAQVNFAKSEGISLITPPGEAELRSKPSFDFLGHDISSVGVAPSRRTVQRLKRNLSRIIHRHLLLYPMSRKQFTPKRLDSCGIDWDLVTCVNELRDYLYGHVSEEQLSGALARKKPLRNTKCALSYFPLVDLPDRFRHLDGWLAGTLLRCHEKRVRVLSAMGYSPSNVGRTALVSGTWYRGTLIHNESKLPSAFRAWLYIRKCRNTFGLHSFPSPPYGY